MLRDGDELRVFHATGKGRALPTVVDLAFVTFVHNILNQVARTGRHNLGASVGTTTGGGQDFDCFRFVHTSMMAQIGGFSTGLVPPCQLVFSLYFSPIIGLTPLTDALG